MGEKSSLTQAWLHRQILQGRPALLPAGELSSGEPPGRVLHPHTKSRNLRGHLAHCFPFGVHTVLWLGLLCPNHCHCPWDQKTFSFCHWRPALRMRREKNETDVEAFAIQREWAITFQRVPQYSPREGHPVSKFHHFQKHSPLWGPVRDRWWHYLPRFMDNRNASWITPLLNAPICRVVPFCMMSWHVSIVKA